MDILNKFFRLLKIPGFHKKEHEYEKNPEYKIRKTIFDSYMTKTSRIVMLGDSITQGADWNELLGRTDIVNRGISGDITEGFVSRISDICKLKPEFCFIMGGINDFTSGKKPEEVFLNYETIIKKLKAAGITPIIQSTLRVSLNFENSSILNNMVNELNMKLSNYAESEKLTYIDINSVLCKNGSLKSEYTYDGLHLLGSGYGKWRDLLISEFYGKNGI